MPAVAQNQNKKNPDEATYAITGYMRSSKSGERVTYELLKLDGKADRITFDKQNHHYGDLVSGEQVRFGLQNVKTKRPEGFPDTLYFWRWNEKAYEWVLDPESGSGWVYNISTSCFNFMIVLDCSKSMHEDFLEMKSSAKYLLRQFLNASDAKGNIRAGIIGFSTMEYSKSHTVAPVPLTTENFYYLCDQIDALSDGGGTALYYSINRATEILQQDFDKNIRGQRFAGAAIIAFTDGNDNTSTDDAQGYTNAEQYLAYTKEVFPLLRIDDIEINSYCVGLRGNDVSDRVWASTVDDFKEIFDQYDPINRIDDLESHFGDIAKNLIKKRTVLQLQMAKGVSGHVGWTFPEEKETVTENPRPPRPIVSTPPPTTNDPKPATNNSKPTTNNPPSTTNNTKTTTPIDKGNGSGGSNRTINTEVLSAPPSKRNPWFGVGGEVVAYFGEETSDWDFVSGGLNFDMAFSTNASYAIGAHFDFNVGNYSYEHYETNASGDMHYVKYIETGVGIMAGPELKFTFSGNNAVLVSAGGGAFSGEGYAFFMLGYKTRKSFYITTKAIVGDGFGGTVGCGFSWGGK